MPGVVVPPPVPVPVPSVAVTLALPKAPAGRRLNARRVRSAFAPAGVRRALPPVSEAAFVALSTAIRCFGAAIEKKVTRRAPSLAETCEPFVVTRVCQPVSVTLRPQARSVMLPPLRSVAPLATEPPETGRESKRALAFAGFLALILTWLVSAVAAAPFSWIVVAPEAACAAAGSATTGSATSAAVAPSTRGRERIMPVRVP